MSHVQLRTPFQTVWFIHAFKAKQHENRNRQVHDQHTWLPHVLSRGRGLSPLLSGDYTGRPLLLNIDCTICVRHWPNSSRIICSAWDKVHPSFSASSAWARRQPHVASTTSSVMHASGHLSTHRSMVTEINKSSTCQEAKELKNERL